jgi:hypothetical protein
VLLNNNEEFYMKKSSVLASIVALSVISLTPVIAAANPMGIDIAVTCPVASNPQPGAFPLTKSGTSIGGTGIETLGGQPSQLQWFQSSSMPQNIPASLTSYTSSSVAYDSSTGTVMCRYQSLGNPDISVAYTLQNAQQGYVKSQTADTIVVTLPIGQSS